MKNVKNAKNISFYGAIFFLLFTLSACPDENTRDDDNIDKSDSTLTDSVTTVIDGGIGIECPVTEHDISSERAADMIK